MSKLPRISVIPMAVVAVATGALACKDTTTPREFSNAGIGQPSFTLAVGFTSTLVGRGAVEVNNVVTFFVPKDSPTRIDAPRPGNCAF